MRHVITATLVALAGSEAGRSSTVELGREDAVVSIFGASLDVLGGSAVSR